jgi:hypothetical protein
MHVHWCSVYACMYICICVCMYIYMVYKPRQCSWDHLVHIDPLYMFIRMVYKILMFLDLSNDFKYACKHVWCARPKHAFMHEYYYAHFRKCLNLLQQRQESEVWPLLKKMCKPTQKKGSNLRQQWQVMRFEDYSRKCVNLLKKMSKLTSATVHPLMSTEDPTTVPGMKNQQIFV